MQNNTTPVKFVITGIGHIGSRHISLLQDMPGTEIVAGIDCNSKCRQKLPGHIPFFESIEEYISKGPKADVANICTPNGLHAEHALTFMNSGMHVLIEKPMALSQADSNAVLNKAAELNKKVFCVLQNRYTPTSSWIKSCVEDKILGEIYMIKANCFWNRDERYYTTGSWRGTMELDGGTLFTQFSHYVDLIYWLFGDWKNIQARIYNNRHKNRIEFEDTGIIHFNTKNGATGLFSFTTAVWDKNMESSLTLIGEKGTIKVGGQYMDKVEYCHVENYKMPDLQKANPPNSYGHFQGSAANHLQVFENIIRALNNQKYEISEGKDAAGVVGLIEKIYNIARTPATVNGNAVSLKVEN